MLKDKSKQLKLGLKLKTFSLGLIILISGFLGWQFAKPSLVSAQIRNPVISTEYGDNIDQAKSGSLLNTILSVVLSFMMVIGALLVLLNLVQAAINWISAGGDSSKVQKARDMIIQAIIGLIIMSATFAIWNILVQFLGVDLDYTILFPGNSGTSSTTGPSYYTPESNEPIDVYGPYQY